MDTVVDYATLAQLQKVWEVTHTLFVGVTVCIRSAAEARMVLRELPPNVLLVTCELASGDILQQQPDYQK